MRPESAWLTAGLSCLAVAVAAHGGQGSIAAFAESVGAAAAVVLRSPDPDLAAARPVLAQAALGGLSALAILAVAIGAAAVLAGAVLGRLGPVRPAVARGLGVKPAASRLRIAIGGAVLISGLLAFDLQRRVAGAARAADASADALAILWRDSAIATLLAAAAAMIAVGVLEALQQRRDQHVALIPTPEQAADEARRSGGRRP